MSSRQFLKQKEQLEQYFRRFGLEGESAFQTIAYHYVITHPKKLFGLPSVILQKWENSYQIITEQKTIIELLDNIISKDSTGSQLPEWYQFFIGRRYREDSGKFFTPQPIASAMGQLLPKRSNAIIIDPTCGGGTFLAELSSLWTEIECTLIANDFDSSLVELTMITLGLTSSQKQIKEFISDNIFDPTDKFKKWYGKIDYILANPPFSLKIENEQFDSKLFKEGYRNSDALFLDTALKLLKSGGRLVCLLPHSIIANQEFMTLRKLIECDWLIRGIIALPEGVFHLSAGTTTRADIVILDKKPIQKKSSDKLIFASVPCVGVRLNNRSQSLISNDLVQIIHNNEVRQTLNL